MTPNDRNHLITKFFKKLPDKKVQCNLCPHNCVIPEDYSGLCKSRANLDGKFVSLVYGRPCSINIDPVEKKPLFHFYPGRDILSIGTYGCNLFCQGCQNHGITRVDSRGIAKDLKYHAPKDIVDNAIKENLTMIAYTYNEPTIFFEYMLDIAKLAKKHDIKNVIVSNGYINPEPLGKLVEYIDAANIDIKGFTEKFYNNYAGSKLQPVIDTVEYIVKNNASSEHKVWLELTNLIIPGVNDDMKDIKRMCEWIASLDKNIPLHFSRFYPYYKAKNKSITPIKTILDARAVALNAGLKYVYAGNLGLEEDTFCKKCRSLLIKRRGYETEIIGIDPIHKNMCSKCKTIIEGVFF